MNTRIRCRTLGAEKLHLIAWALFYRKFQLETPMPRQPAFLDCNNKGRGIRNLIGVHGFNRSGTESSTFSDGKRTQSIQAGPYYQDLHK